MTGRRRRTSSRHATGENALTRDSQGRWVRRAGGSNAPAAQDFVFDNHSIEEMQPSAAQSSPPPFRLDDAEDTPEGGPDVSAGNRPPDSEWTKNDFGPVAPATATKPEAARRFGPLPPSSLRLLGGALLFGIVFFLFQRGYFDARKVDEIAPPPPTIVAPVPAPVVPALPVPHPAARADAPPARRQARGTLLATAGESLPALPALPAPAPAGSEEDGWFSLAEEYLQLGDEQRAEALYRQLYSEGTQRGRAALALGDLCTAREDFECAEEYYRDSQLLFQQNARPTAAP